MKSITFSGPARLLLGVSVILYLVWFSYLSIDRWDNLHASLDYAHIDSASYNTAHGKWMYSNVDHIDFWADHFSPILLVLSGYYLFSDGYWLTFIWQTLTIGLSAIPLFLIARHFLRSEPAAFLVALGYLVNGKLQYANIFDYHMMSHEPLFLFTAFYALLHKRWGWYFACGALLVVCKEDAFILFALLGFYAAVVEREYKMALFTWILCGAYAFIVFKIAYPYLTAQEHYGYSGQYGWLGRSLAEKVIHLFSSPLEVLKEPLSWNENIWPRWRGLLIQYGFLPFLSLTGVIMILPPTAELYLAKRGPVISLAYHYPLLIVPMWTLATVFALSNIRNVTLWLEEKWGSLSVPGKVLKIFKWLSIAVMTVYAIVIIYFIIYGSFDFKIYGSRVYMDSAAKPLLIFYAAFFVYVLCSSGGYVARLMGGSFSLKVVMALTIYLVGVNLYMAQDYGALPVYSSWIGVIKSQHRDHAGHVKNALKTIPAQASILASQGPFTHLAHRSQTHLFRGFDSINHLGIDFDYIVVDIKPNVESQRGMAHAHVAGLLLLKEYGVIDEEDGLFIFKRGADKKTDHKLYSKYVATSSARRMGTGPGRIVADKTSPFVEARKAEPGEDRPGIMAYGPYLTLAKGSYKAFFRMKADDNTGSTVAVIEVTARQGKKILAHRNLSGLDFKDTGQWRTFEMTFVIDNDKTTDVEARVHFAGETGISVDMTKIKIPYRLFIKNLWSLKDQ
ncbi:hypothetical protein MNBD_NITROSPINAE04-2207 [hydrothermal vent metagenome]|uniref:DUF2079 domain-containing protein n=1 Tax=hydrothermal vent metagenome TaxID=652676 RepID=A0A3B1BY23_9ZZZZ